MLIVNILQILLAFPQKELMAAANFVLAGKTYQPDLEEAIAYGLDSVTNILIDRASPIIRTLIASPSHDAEQMLAFYRLYVIEDVWKVVVWRYVIGNIEGRIGNLPTTSAITVALVRDDESSRLMSSSLLTPTPFKYISRSTENVKAGPLLNFKSISGGAFKIILNVSSYINWLLQDLCKKISRIRLARSGENCPPISVVMHARTPLLTLYMRSCPSSQ